MKIDFEINGNTMHISFHGDILYAETIDLSGFFDKRLAESFDEAVLDFSDVTGITSSAIGAVIDFHGKLKKKSRSMRISGMSDKAYTVFKYFKLDELFPIEK
ncbi:MAG: STAS domain-containing protein [Calditrichia bacterium]|nr:STAS domain-containing protein [Calditrichota bacterium]MCB0267573.1 STAS domain-containing protein [Calditrichota bacterium]MCB9067978.1 STAS domain-containing protein [Calditrichia bacterium]